ncbi:sulfurtransferase complex subunit TusB [Aliivibrio fischeri]|uniref:sulfurtransferase complex subunit TusB n=1 Tax=Aliivibrio fischeri TaxID=668 RepID=UPI0007C56B1E|nr:sulfurtransferase complex subunit TusB [Aliivibrio fischeri]MCE7566262.1 sulfurtransferase complex subunit TusB [Aliivibrio fischeri]MUK39938.1 sulfurtransferase complex subunit TusB [Aliivibrio fischeri]TDM56109.1 sulfurtransferase complex subunit TusB [Aliivibrio fischeri]
MMLHILTSTDNLQLLHNKELPVNSENDVIIFTQDSVYAAIKDHKDHLLILSFKHCYFLQEDIEARGVTKLIDDKIQRVNYSAFVSLTQDHFPIVTW